MSTEIEFLDELPSIPRHSGGGNRDPRIAEFADAGNRDPRIAEFADALRANAGKWAKYPNQLGRRTAYSYVTRINRPDCGTSNMPTALRSGEFEAKVRAATLYVRAKA